MAKYGKINIEQQKQFLTVSNEKKLCWKGKCFDTRWIDALSCAHGKERAKQSGFGKLKYSRVIELERTQKTYLLYNMLRQHHTKTACIERLFPDFLNKISKQSRGIVYTKATWCWEITLLTANNKIVYWYLPKIILVAQELPF